MKKEKRKAREIEISSDLARSVADAVTSRLQALPSAEGKQLLPGGTTRSEKAPPFHLVPPEGFRRIALRFGLGAERHGEGNWQLALQTEEGRRAFIRTAYDHMVEHTIKLVADEEPDDDHLAAIGWCVYALCYVEEHHVKFAKGMKK